MILVVIGLILMTLGTIVFFRKDEGETEISLLGAKLKSNRSSILLLCLGALLATFGIAGSDSSRFDASQPEKANNSNDQTSRNDICKQLDYLANTIDNDPSILKGTLVETGEVGSVYTSKATVSDFPTGLYFFSNNAVMLLIKVRQPAGESQDQTMTYYTEIIEECFPEHLKKKVNYEDGDGNSLYEEAYQVGLDLVVAVIAITEKKKFTYRSPISIEIRKSFKEDFSN